MFKQASPCSRGRSAGFLANSGGVHPSLGSRYVLALALFLVLPLAAQSPVLPGPESRGHFGKQQSQSDSDTGFDGRIEAKRITQLNLMRQRALVSDANKLLRLAQELNDDANAAMAMSPGDRMRKAAEIEHLAKEVKEKMTYAIGAPADPSAFPLGYAH